MNAWKSPTRTVVAIPARDEASLIAACLGGLSVQSTAADDIVLVVNNTSDETVRLARNCVEQLPARLHVADVTLPAHQANAGFVRRLAMEKAAEIAGPQGVILTTDADARVPPHWIARNLFWFAQGYDAVCGMVAIDPVDEAELPPHLLADNDAETCYTRILDEIDCLADPRPWDPWPRHTHRSGSSIAVRAAVYSAAGGLPNVSHSEDRKFIARLEQRDCKIRHDPGLTVTVSGRRVGRAPGGMAATIARRLITQDLWADGRLERPQPALRRAQLRRQARIVWTEARQCGPLAARLSLPEAAVAIYIRSPWFGAAWALMEERSPVLARPPVAMADLRALIGEAELVLAALRRDTNAALSDKESNAGAAPALAE
jgi:Glycosyltransferase like family 2